MTERGYVKYKGQWKLPQEIELIEKKREQEAAQQEWFQKLKLWRGWLGGDRDEAGPENIHGIDDPVAVKALAIGLRDDSIPGAPGCCTSTRWRRSIRPTPPWPWPSPRSTIRWTRCD